MRHVRGFFAAFAALTFAAGNSITIGAGAASAAGRTEPGQAQIVLPYGVTPTAGMSTYATDNCLYQFDGAFWQPQVHCRHFPDPGNTAVFDLYDRSTGLLVGRIDMSEPGWVKERQASGPGAGVWLKFPLNDLLKYGKVGPNNTFILVGGQWVKQLDLQQEQETALERERVARMTPAQAEAYWALQARLAETKHRISMRALGYVPVYR
jgi:hypothetical protein